MSVTLSLFAGAGAQFFDNSGNLLTGGKIYTYAAGTTTPATTYTSSSGSSAHTNPIILDAAGRVSNGGEIWLTLGVGYKFIVKTSTDVLIATYDNIPSSAQPPAANDADSIMYEQGYVVTAGNFVVGRTYRILTVGNTNYTLIGAVSNSVGVHFIATGVGSGTGTAELSRTVEQRLQDTVSVKDFGAVGDGVTDDTLAIQAAIDYASSLGIPTTVTAAAGENYLITPKVTLNFAGVIYGCCLFIKSNVYLDFNMATVTYTQPLTGSYIICFTNGYSAVSNFAIKNISFENTDVGNTAQSVILLNGGINTDPLDFVTDFQICNLQSNKSGVLVQCQHGRSNSTRAIKRFNIENLTDTNCQNCTVYLLAVEQGTIDNIITDTTNYDVLMIFSAKDVTISNIVGKNVSDNLIGLEARNFSDVIEDINISNVASDSGKISAVTVNSGNIVQNITMNNINARFLYLDNSGLGTLKNFQIRNLKLTTLNSDRTAFINKLFDSTISMIVEERGSSTIETVAVKASSNIDIDVSVVAPLSTTPAFVSFYNTRLRAKVTATGGSHALYFRGTLGPTQQSKFDVFASSQSTAAVGYDGTSNINYDFTVNGIYNGQPLQMSNSIGDRGVVNLAYGIGPNVGVVSDTCAVTNEIHFLTAQSGTADDLGEITGGLKGQVVTLYAVNGTTITVQTAGTGTQNIFPKGFVNRGVTFTAPMVLQYNGTFWLEL